MLYIIYYIDCYNVFIASGRYPDSRLARMFNGQIPVVLDSLKQHYFIDRDGALFRHVLNYLRAGELALPEDFAEHDQLLDEARYYDIGPLVDALETLQIHRCSKRRRKETTGCGSGGGSEVVIGEYDCVTVTVHPELNERIALNAERSVLEEVFPEVGSAVNGTRNSGWVNGDNQYVIGFPLNGFCKLNSLQVIQRLLNSGFSVASSNSSGMVEGQQFSQYLFIRSM